MLLMEAAQIAVRCDPGMRNEYLHCGDDGSTEFTNKQQKGWLAEKRTCAFRRHNARLRVPRTLGKRVEETQPRVFQALRSSEC
jgi:hypothetical protein